MKIKVRLIYDSSLNKVLPNQAQVLIKAKGYKQILIPAIEVSTELWERIPLSPNDFYTEISTDEFFDYAEYKATYRLQEIVGLGAIISELENALPQINSTTLSNGFLRCWNSDQRVEYVYYSESEAFEVIEEIKQEFIENCLRVPTQESKAFRIAQQVGLELLYEPEPQARWIDYDCFCNS